MGIFRRRREQPKEEPIEKPRIEKVEEPAVTKKEGQVVFACDCRGVMKLPEDFGLGEDVFVFKHSYLCSPEGKKFIEEKKRELNVKDTIIAGCTPRIAERLFGKLDVEVVNIREQVAYVDHGVEKMKALVRGAIEKKKKSKKMEEKRSEIISKEVLIIGAGVSGLNVARHCAKSGLPVCLIEKRPFVGGMVGKLDRVYPEGLPVSHTLNPYIFEVAEKENVKILTNCELQEIKGNLGNYTVKLKQKPNPVKRCNLCGKCKEVCPIMVSDQGLERKAIYFEPTYPDTYAIDWDNCNKCGKCSEICPEIDLEVEEKELELKVGAVVVATGLEPFDASKIESYGYGKYKNVYTAIEFERKFTQGKLSPESVVIINCAGSRDEHYLNYCSQVCCFIGLKEAKLIKDTNPNIKVYVTYIDMRAYGVFEELYTKLRDVLGVTFIKGRPAEVFERNGKLVVQTEDTLLNEILKIETDCVVLSTGFVPPNELLKKLKLPVEEGAFPTNYVCSSLSIDANPHGIYITGAAAYPQDATSCIMSANYVAENVVTVLSKDFVKITRPVSAINTDICSGKNCRICLSLCPYEAIIEEEEELKVDYSLCRGCGICVAACGAGANQLEMATDSEMHSQIEGLLRGSEGKIVAFLCENCSYEAADSASYEKLSYPENTMIIKIPCTGRIDSQLLLKAFCMGAKGVLVGGCSIGACHYVNGNVKAQNRVRLTRRVIQPLGIEPSRLRIEWIGSKEPAKLVRVLNEMNQ